MYAHATIEQEFASVGPLPANKIPMVLRGRDYYGRKAVLKRSFLRGRPHDIYKTSQLIQLLTTAQERHFCRRRRESCRNRLPVTSALHSNATDPSPDNHVTAKDSDHNAKMRAF